MKTITGIIIILLYFILGSCKKTEQEPVAEESMDAMADMLSLTHDQITMINLQVDSARIKSIFETSDFIGIAAIDENNIRTISSRVSGRIEKLFIRNPGEELHKGEPIYTIYSEELMSDENEFLLTLEHQSKNEIQSNTLDILVESSRKKLQLWGLSDTQINELIKNKTISPTVTFYSSEDGYLSELIINEGEYVSEGSALFEIASLETVWVNAEIYQSEIYYLSQNPTVELKFEGIPNQIFRGDLILTPPVLNDNRKISSVRIAVENRKGLIIPGMMATVSIKRNQKTTLVIPKSALLLSEMATFVWVESMDGMYEKKIIVTGIENKTEIEVLSGINRGDKVVTTGSYLLNSAFVLMNGADAMGGMVM